MTMSLWQDEIGRCLTSYSKHVEKSSPSPKEPRKPKAKSDAEEAAEEAAIERVLAAFDTVLDEWYMFGIHRVAAKKFIKDRVCGDSNDCSRVRQWFVLRMNSKVWNHGYKLMCRAPENVPGLRSYHVWPREAFPWLDGIETMHETVLEELMSVRASSSQKERSGFQPYRDPIPTNGAGKNRVPSDGVGVEGVDRGNWNVMYLFLNHKRFDDNCAKFPKTIAAIEKLFPRHYSHAFFSALTPGSHITAHHGPSNRMLRCWLPVCGLDGFKLRVGDTIVQPTAGKCFVWDHSYEHEAWHEGDETRIVLIVDIWHPDLTDPEVKILSTMQNCRLRAGRAMLEEHGSQEDKDATYFGVIEKAASLLSDDDWWVIKAELDPTTKPT